MSYKVFAILLLKKFLFGFAVIFLVANLLFLGYHVLPGDPINVIFPRGGPQNTIDEWRLLLGLDKPMIEKYFDFIGGLFTCDLGVSFKFAQRIPISKIIMPFILRTLFLFGLTVAMAVLIGGIIGKLMLNCRNSIYDRIVSGLAVVGFALSSFIIANFLILFVVTMIPGWPLYGFLSPESYFDIMNPLVKPIAQFLDFVIHATIPLISLGLTSICGIYLLIRRGISDWNRQKTSIEGEPEQPIISSFLAFLGGFVSVRPLFRLYLAFIMISTLTIDWLFTYKGLGYLTFESILILDFPLLIASVWLQTLILFFTIFIFELLIDLAIYLTSAKEKNNYLVVLDEDVAKEKLIAETSIKPQPYLSSQCNMHDAPKFSEFVPRVISEFLHRPRGMIALAVFLTILVMGLVGPFVASENPLAPKLRPENSLPQPPSDRHPFGTDFDDKDILSQFLYAARTDVIACVMIIVYSVIGGALLGMTCSLFGRIVDAAVRLILEAFLLLTFFLPMIVIIVIGRTHFIGAALCAGFAIIPVALTVRNEISVCQAERKQFSRWFSLLRLDLFEAILRISPKLIFAVKIVFVLAISFYFLLSVLGLGDPLSISWGWIMERALDRSAILNLWWWWFMLPIIGILLLVFSIYFIFDSLEIVLENVVRDKKGKTSVATYDKSKK